MIKIILLLFFIFSANAKVEFVLTSYDTHYRKIEEHSIEIESAAVKVDGESLSLIETTIKSALIGELNKLLNNETKSHCEGRHFELQKKENQMTQKIMGCLGDHSWKTGKNIFKKLKKNILMND